MPSLSPSFVNVTVNLPAVAVVPQSFNIGLIVGNSSVISTVTRVAKYNSLADMVTAGFALNSPEYLAATLYFGATSQPTQVCIGRKGSGETSLAALQACRAASSDWYAAYDTTAGDSDQAAIAAYFETLTAPFSQYYCKTSTAAVAAGTGGNIFETLHTGAYKRTHGMFSSTAHATAAIMGYDMGQTSNLANSYYTNKFKKLPGVTPEPLTTAQISTIKGYNGNVYVTESTDIYEDGKNFSGQWFDEVIGLDMLCSNIQTNITNLLTSVPSVPQTEAGMAQLRSVVAEACETASVRGFLAEGVWTGSPILTLTPGTVVPRGYLIMSDPISGQSSSDRGNRIAPNVYACIKEAGAIHSVVLAINVNR